MTDTAVLDRASALEGDDWRAAIELLEGANRVGRDDQLEIALAALRHRAHVALLREARAGSPPAPSASPPVGERGLPEAELGSFDAAELRGALLEHGCLLVPGALPPERCAELAAAIDRGFEAQDPERDASAAGAWWAPLQLEPEAAVGLGRKWVRGGGGVLLADSPRLMAAVLDLYTAVGLRDLVGAYLGGRPVLSANKCTLRRVAPTSNGDWHQDGAFLGRGIRALNLWVTLTPCGVDAPGLDVVPRRLDGIVETGTGGAYFDWAVGPALVESTAGPARRPATRVRGWRPDDLRRPLPPPHRRGARDAPRPSRHRAVELRRRRLPGRPGAAGLVSRRQPTRRRKPPGLKDRACFSSRGSATKSPWRARICFTPSAGPGPKPGQTGRPLTTVSVTIT